MATLDIPGIIQAAVEVILSQEKNLSLQCNPKEIKIKFPTTRSLAKYLGVPHYYVLPIFAMMEEQHLVTREQRVGIWTTGEGSRQFFAALQKTDNDAIHEILPEDLLSRLINAAERK
jgi:DNA-binding transcriptional regulator YhcF (GntR family)